MKLTTTEAIELLQNNDDVWAFDLLFSQSKMRIIKNLKPVRILDLHFGAYTNSEIVTHFRTFEQPNVKVPAVDLYDGRMIFTPSLFSSEEECHSAYNDRINSFADFIDEDRIKRNENSLKLMSSVLSHIKVIN